MRHGRLAGAITVALLVGCGSDDPGGGSAGTPAGVLVKSSTTPADAACPSGGTKLEFGADKNGNGTLDADEVTGTQTVCNPGAAPTLTKVTPTGPSAKCKNGGMTVQSGPDTNGNGVLDPSEVKETTEICGGGTSTELSRTTNVPAGDVNCPFGGLRTETGIDNGANGSVAGDGVLQPGEVTSTSLACVAGGASPSSLAPPGGAAGTAQILTTGGAGSAGAGGPAGGVQIGFLSAGSLGGHVKVFKTGKADASFTVPSEKPVFGATKLDVTANRTIATYASSASAVDGEYYTINNSGLFFRQNAGSPQVPVTGVHVAAGATLTFPATGIGFTLSDDFHNEGTITTGLTAGNRGPIQMAVAKYIGAATSKIAQAGAPQAGAAGGNGGPLVIAADRIVNAGAIDTSGANGDAGGAHNGGNAGPVQLLAQRAPLSGPVYNAGSVKMTGGTSKATAGSSSLFITVANTRGVFLEGNIDLSGGVGGGQGGNAGLILVNAGGAGSLRMSGNLTARGGDVDEVACAATCAGGNGGQLQQIVAGGDLIWDGDIIMPGGKSKGTSGRPGGQVLRVVVDTPDPQSTVLRPAGSIHASGTIDLRGGAGTTGGPGGTLLSGSNTSQPHGAEIELLGYAAIDASGGQGTTAGGPGGLVRLFNPPAAGGAASGGVANHAAITAKGGVATTSGAGGPGGNVQLVSGSLTTAASLSQAIVSAGTIDVSGGNGVAAGGPAGPIDLQSRERIDVFAAITANGGNQSAAAGAAGGVAPAQLRTSGALVSTATIALKGGNGAGAGSTGGSCAGLVVHGGTVNATAAISCAGGNGTGAAGGNGGAIDIGATQASSAVAGVSAAGGTGAPAGTTGTVTIDGNPQ